MTTLVLILTALVPALAPAAAAAPAHANASNRLPETSLASPASRAPASSGSRPALAANILQRLRDAKVPMTAVYLPNLVTQVRTSGGLVHPLYTVGPAPMGLGDFGVRNTTGVATGYILQSRSWEGILNLTSANALYLDSGVPDWFGAQLNTVMTNTTVVGDTNDTFWIQNVIQYSTLTNSLTFLDNIWNFSNPSTAEPATTFYKFCPSGLGGPSQGAFYYCYGPTYTVPFPFTVKLFVNSSMTVNTTTHDEWSTVDFGFVILNGTGVPVHAGTYDTVLFNSSVTTSSLAPMPVFTVNGFTPNPVGLLDDSELMIGGPGGGSTTTLYAIGGTEQLKYLSGSNYVNDPTAWNEGTDTGETSEGISEYYTTAGTVHLGVGPSIPMPFWNATPGGNIGEAIIQGHVTPSNSFFWINQGPGFDPVQSAWAPVPASGQYDWVLPPGSYFIRTEASEFLPNETVMTLASGTNHYNVTMTAFPAIGIYTPLWAWNNAQLANISSGGTGTAADPYVLANNEYGSLDPLYAQVNDYFFPVFDGIFLAYTTAHVEIDKPAAFTVTFPSQYASGLAHFGLPDTNELPIQVYYASSISIWQGAFTGWFPGAIFGFPIYTPIANVAFWGVTGSLVGASTFLDQGSALLSALGTNNVFWGNTVLTGPTLPSFYAGSYPFGIQILESGDLIYNNYVATTFPAWENDTNFYTGAHEVHRDNWNLSAVEPSSQVKVVNGHELSGSIVGSPWQCGNFWSNYVPGSALPYDNPQILYVNNVPTVVPFIQTGGDYCPYPLSTSTVTFSETGLTSGTWSVTLGGLSATAAAGSSITFAMPPGTWTYTVGAVPGHTVNPATGTVHVTGAPQSVPISIGNALAATLAATPTATDVGQRVSFTATPFGGSGTYTYAWSFGDSSSASTATASHTYAAAGTYTVLLWVNDSVGGSVTQQTTVTVKAVPTATASASATSVTVGTSVTFTGGSSGGTAPVAFSWDFGDGSLSSATSPSHTYATAGSYTVTLTVTDAVGVTATKTLTVTVTAVTPPPPPTDVVSTTTATAFSLGGLVAGIAIGAVVTLLLRRRKGGDSGPSPPQPPSP